MRVECWGEMKRRGSGKRFKFQCSNCKILSPNGFCLDFQVKGEIRKQFRRGLCNCGTVPHHEWYSHFLAIHRPKFGIGNPDNISQVLFISGRVGAKELYCEMIIATFHTIAS